MPPIDRIRESYARDEPLAKARSLRVTLPMNGIRRDTADDRFRNEMNFAKAVRQRPIVPPLSFTDLRPPAYATMLLPH
jgi:hypothetical protein